MTSRMMFAKKIPDTIRSQFLMGVDDPIQNVVSAAGNKHMQTLFTIYYEFIQPFAGNGEKDINCFRCRGKIIQSFKNMRADLEALEKEYQEVLALLNNI